MYNYKAYSVALLINCISQHMYVHVYTTPHHNRFTALFPGPPGWAGARRELLDFMVQGKINRGRHKTIRLGATPSGLTNAHLHHPRPFFRQVGCPSCRPNNSV